VQYLTLQPGTNLVDPAYGAECAAASFTNANGTTFRGGVINASIAPIAGSAHAADATTVLDHLFSPNGQRLLRTSGFLSSPLLTGGDQTAVPDELKRYVRGTYHAN
jgi:ABC-type Fe3+ transport system substrate-binding protein